ncbi:hypothetical protein LINGRAHAP2_LOCUS5111 [Linum grandiflorum]
MERRLAELSLIEGEDMADEVPVPAKPVEEADYTICVVGTIFFERSFNFEIIKQRMAEIWRPTHGMLVQHLGDKLYVFNFFSQAGFEMGGRSWPVDAQWISSCPTRDATRRETTGRPPERGGFLGAGIPTSARFLL